MDTVLDPVVEVQERVIEAIAGTKQPVVDAVTRVVEVLLERLPAVPALPYADKLPTPAELVDNQAKFAAKLVSTNKSVALAAAKAAAPLTNQLLDRPSAPAARRAKAVKTAA